MNREDAPPSDEERREAELLGRALEERTEGDVRAVEDALGAASMLRASRSLDLTDLRGRAVLERVWRERPWRSRARAAGIIAVAAAAAAAAALLVVRSRAHLPAPSVDLVRAQLAAARPGSPAAVARFEQEQAKYRGEVYAALRRAYGARP